MQNSAKLLQGLTVVLIMFLTLPVNAGVINQNLIASPENQEALLQLNAVPLTVTESTSDVILTWSPAVTAQLYYSNGAPGNNRALYRRYAGPQNSSPGRLEIEAANMDIGWLTCFLASVQDTSVFFTLIIASPQAPQRISPSSPRGGEGIHSYTPDFIWDPVDGVPYYQVILADQPFTIEQDENGTRVEGANIIWTVVTPETQIQYGVPDPSGVIRNVFVPPLIGDITPDRPRYNWLVLNNYGNHPAFSSTVTGGITGFEVEIAAPFARPVNTSPAHNSTIFGGDIRFTWSDIPEAVSYFIYVSRLEISEGGSSATILIWSDQTTTNAKTCPAANYLENAHYVWKVMALNEQGRGTMSDTTGFDYVTEAGRLTIHTYERFEGPPVRNVALGFCTVDFQVVEGPAIIPTMTDDNGYYSREIPVGVYIPVASKDNYQTATGQAVTIVDGGQVNSSLYLTRLPYAITGSVQDDEGEAVNNAQVIANGPEGQEETLSNINGEFSFNLSAGTWEFVVQKDGYEQAEARIVNVGGDNPSIDLDLPGNGGTFILTPFTYRLSGYIRNRQNLPIANANVRIENDVREFQYNTAENGFYNFTLGNGLWTLAAARPGFYLESGPLDLQIAGQDVTQNVVLAPQAVVISGSVVPQGLDDLRIHSYPTLGGIVQEALPTENGYYSMGVEPGSYTIRGVLEGYTSNEVQLVLAAGDPPGVANIIMMVNSAAINGRVQDTQGTRLSGARVVAGDVAVTTDQVGNYSINLLPGIVSLTASKPNYSNGTAGPFNLGHGQVLNDIVIVLNPNSARVTGRVTVGGVGLPGATVTASRQGGNPVTVLTREAARNVQPGTFEMGLDPGSYTLTASKPGFVNQPPQVYQLLLEPNAQVERNFALQQYIGTLSGTVTSNGQLLQGVSIRITPLVGGGQPFTSTSDDWGGYRVIVTPDRAYQITASKTNYNTVNVQTVVIGVGQTIDTPIQMTFVSSSVSGIVRANNVPIANVSVTAEGPGGDLATRTNIDGRYQLSMTPGDYEFTINNAGYREIIDTLTINPGQNLSGVNWNLQENFATISGRVMNTAGQGLARANLEVIRAEGGNYVGTADLDGYYTFNRLIGGSYQVRASVQGHTAQTRNVGMVLDGQRVVNQNFNLVPQTSGFTGFVCTQDGLTTISGATVWATAANGTRYSATSGANGSYTVQNIPNGTYSLIAQKAGYTGVNVTNQTVAPGNVNQLDLSVILNNGQIAGMVRVGVGGLGLSGATLTAYSNLGHHSSAVSDGSGAFTVTGLFPNTTYTVFIVRDNYTADEDTLRNIAVNQPGITFTMLPNNLRFSGRTVNQANTPIPNVPVQMTNIVNGTVFQTTSNANGEFTIQGLGRNSTYQIVTNLFAPGYDDARATVSLQLTDVTGYNLQMVQRTSSISGNAGVANVTVSSVREGGGINYTTISDLNGNYRIGGLRGGNYTITPVLRGYIFNPTSATVTNVGINEARTGVNFTANSVEVTVSGNLVNATNQPMVNHQVRLTGEAVSRTVTTDQNGAFTFTAVRGYANYQIGFVAPGAGYTSTPLYVALTNQNVAGLILQVTIRLGVIEGEIRSSENNSLITQPVFIQVNQNEPLQFAGGAFHLNRLLAGPYTLRFTSQDFEPYIHPLIMLSSGADTVRAVTAQMTPLTNALFFYVYRLTDNGEQAPIRGARVRVTQDDNVDFSGVTELDGIYYIPNLSVLHTYSVSISKLGFSSVTVPNPMTPGQRLDQRLLPLEGTVLGIVRDNINNARWQGARVVLQSSEGTIYQTTTDEYGSYSMVAPQGSFTLLAISQDDQRASYIWNRTVPVGDFAFQEMRIRRVENRGEIVGVVRDVSGNPLATRAYISEFNQTANTYGFTFTDANGNYRLRGLRPGNITISITAPGYISPNPRVVVMSPGLVYTENWDLEAGATGIVGTIIRTDTHAGIDNVRVQLSGPVDMETFTSGSGSYSFLDLEPAEDYVLSMSKFGYVTLPDTTVEVVFGAITNASRAITPIANQISGTVYQEDGVTVMPNVIVILNDETDTMVYDTTEVEGHFSFDNLLPGTYDLSCSGPFAPQLYRIAHDDGESHPGYTFRNIPELGQGTVIGWVFYKHQPRPSVPVTLTRLGSPDSQVQNTNSSGRVTFTAPAPATYRLSAIHELYGSTQSSSFNLAGGGTYRDTLYFPSAKITVHLVDEQNLPVVNHQVFISQNQAVYSQTFRTDNNGFVSTEANLQAGDYNVSIAFRNRYLLTAPEVYTIGEGDSLGLELLLGIPYTPPSYVETREDLPIEITVPGAFTVETAKLYWRDVGGGALNSIDMTPIGDLLSHQGRTKNQDARIFNEAANEQVTYRGVIPGQVRSGTLSFYPEIILTNGSMIGGEAATYEIDVLNIGLLYRLIVQPPIEEAQIGVPYLFTVQAFDEYGSNLTASIISEGENTITWSVTGGSLAPEDIQHPEKIIYNPETVGDASVSVSVLQPSKDAYLERRIPIENRFRVLESIIVSVDRNEIPSGGTALFQATAFDTGGVLMRIDPEWIVGNTELGVLTPKPYSQEATYVAQTGVFGRVPISVRDKDSGIEGIFNELSESKGISGLKIYIPLSSSPNRRFSGITSNNVKVEGKFLPATIPGKMGKLHYNQPHLASVQRFTVKNLSLLEYGHEIMLEGQLYEQDIKYQITFPLPPFNPKDTPQIAKWNNDQVKFDILGGLISPDKSSITLTFLGEEMSIDGLYTLLVDSKPLTIDNLKFNPNPFSPEGDYPLSIEFSVYTNVQEEPWVTIEIYNMAGEHVRTLKERDPIYVGPHHRGNHPIIWDGRTDDGRMARNGRYVVQIIAEDAKNKVEKIETVVLIK